MKLRTIRSPLTWLGGLLVVYLVVPIVAFLVRFSGSHDRGFQVRRAVERATGLGLRRQHCHRADRRVRDPAGLHAGPLPQPAGRNRRTGGAAAALALPPLMSGILLIYLVGPYTALGRFFHGRLTNSLTGVILAQSFVAAPFLVIAARVGLCQRRPVARRGGGHARPPPAGPLPAGQPARGRAPGSAPGCCWRWLRAFGEYGATVLLAYHPYSLPVYTDVQFSGTGLFTTQAPDRSWPSPWPPWPWSLSRLRRPRRGAGRRPPARAPTPSGHRRADPGVVRPRRHRRHLPARRRPPGPSHRLAILGPSGSGKSLTLRSLAGPSRAGRPGPVAYGDRAVQRIPTERRRIGYVPQSARTLSPSHRWQQLLFATDADHALAAWWLDTLAPRRVWRTAIPISFRAASASGSAWPRRSAATLGCRPARRAVLRPRRTGARRTAQRGPSLAVRHRAVHGPRHPRPRRGRLTGR